MSSRVSRRRFLEQSSGALAWAATGAFLPTAAGEQSPRKITVAAHPWVYAATMENYDITPALDRIFADMKYAEMDAIELMHNVLLDEATVGHIAKLMEEHQLPVLGTSFGAPMWDRSQHGKIWDDAQQIITRLAGLGGRTLGISVGDTGGQKTAQQLDDQAELLRRMISLCETHGIVLNLHNHTYEVRDGQHDLLGTLERIPDAKLGPDLDWLVQADVDPVAFLLQHGPRIVFLHLRDQRRDKTWVEAMGEGEMNYDAIRGALRQIQFSGDAVIELAHPRDLQLTRPLRESLKISRQFVRDKLGY